MMSHRRTALLLATLTASQLSSATVAEDRNYFEYQDSASGTLMKAKTGEVLVRFSSEVDAAGRTAVAELVSGTLDAKRPTRRLHRIRLQPGDDPIRVAQLLAADPRVEGASPSILGSYEALPNDPGVANWWFKDLPFPGELETYFTNYVSDERVIIVLMDSGIDFEHEELKENLRLSTNANQNAFIRLFENFTEEQGV